MKDLPDESFTSLPFQTPSKRAEGTLGLGALALAVALALLAQHELTPVGAITLAIVLYDCAVVLVLFCISRIDRIAPVLDPMLSGVAWHAKSSARHGSVRRGVALGLIVGGLLALAEAVNWLAISRSSAVALPLWIVSLVMIALGSGLWAGFPWGFPRARAQVLEAAGILAIMAVAFAYRFPNLAGIPVDVHGDEAAVGLAARQILQGNATDLFGLGWASLPELSFVGSALSMRVFGDDLFGLRMASVIQGTLAVGLLYGVVKRLFSWRIGALAALVLAASQMAVHYSRIGNNYIQALFVSLLLFYFLLRGLASGQPLEFLIAGFAAGFAFDVYYPARLTVGLAVLYCVHRAISERQFARQHWRGLLVLVFGAVVFFAPEAVQYLHDPLSGLTRTSEVFVLRPANLAHEYGAYRVDSVGAVLWRQFINSIDAFNLRGETSQQYGQVAPLLDFWSGALFVLGAAVASVRLGEARYFLLAAWFWLTLVFGSVLTLDAMFSPHIVAALGVIAVLPCLVVEAGWRGLTARFGKIGAQIGALVALIFVLLVARANYVDYFQIHVQTMEPSSFFTVLARYAESVNGQYRIYLLADRDTSLHYDTVRFLVPHLDGVDVRDRPLPMPLQQVPSTKGVVFVDPSREDPRFVAIEHTYPGGALELHRSNHGAPQFYSYRVSHRALMAADDGP